VAWLPLGGIILGRAMRKNSFRLPLNETVVGLCITVALTSLWGFPALEQTNWQFLAVGMGEHVVFRSVGVIDGHGVAGALGFIALLPLYFLTFFVSFLPWTIHKPEGFEPWLSKQKQKGKFWHSLAFVLWGLLFALYIPIKIWRWWPKRNRDELGWYLLMQALIVFAVFSLVRTKLPHYTMPAFACIALWLAREIGGQNNLPAWAGKRLAGMVILVAVLTLGFIPFAKNYLLTENLWRAAKPHVRPETKVACLGYTEPSLVWKFRSVVTNTVTLGDVKLAQNFLTNAPPFILVLPTKDFAKLTDTNGILFRAHGLDMVKFKNWELTALVRE
jgi:4-amino-4-deoxy-L-arabinose transferase-like glycosyltransferase